jgi:DNA excision repair protein ERCC-2
MTSYECLKCKKRYSIDVYEEDRFCKKCGSLLKKSQDVVLGGWKKLFPYEPYPQQVKFIEDVERFVGNGGVLIAEACNGFGKTVSSLSALLAMRKTIIYATRTHEQVRQVLNELENINEKSGKKHRAVNLASRSHLCINPECKVLPRNDAQEMCHALRKNEECQFISDIFELPKKLPPVLSKKVLIYEGQKRNICPYYLSRKISKICDVIVAPYPYVFNPMIRLTTDLDLEGKTLILDEGHNIDQVGQDIFSDTLTERGLAESVEELKLVGKSPRYLNRLEEFIHTKNMEKPRTISPNRLEREIENALESDINGFFDIHAPLVEGIRTKKLQTGNPPVSYLNGGLSFLELLQTSQKSKYIGIYKKNYYGANVIEYRCLDPSLALKPVVDDSEGVLIMSGTITPLDLFAEIIGQPKSTKRAYQSIQDPKNVQMIIDTGVTTTFRERTEEMMTRIGSLVAEELSAVRQGTLMFFTQRDFLNRCLDVWKKKGLIKTRGSRMYLSGKVLFREGRDAKQNRRVVERYKRMAVSIGGAVLCCVFRGRNSEGSNFPDDEARGIFLVGVPYANYGDPFVRAQIKYYDKIRRGMGQGWYTMDAFRAANQSLGRGIRGREDWCHFWLLDRRYAEYRNLISTWALGEEPEIRCSRGMWHQSF